MLTLAMPQSLPGRREEGLRVLQAVGEQRRGQAVAEPLLQPDRLLERVDRDQVQNRCEGLVLHDRPVVAREHDRRLDEVARALSAWPPVQQLAAGGLRACASAALKALDRRRVDQRAHQRVGIERIADAHLPVGVHQAQLEFRCDRARGPSTRRVLVQRWPAVPTAPNTMARHRQIQIRGLIDDDRVVAAELEQALAETRGDALSDAAADLGRTGERHERDAPVVHEPRRRARCRQSMNI